MKHEICKLDDIPQSGTLVAPFFGREVHVFRSGDKVRAVANVCMHFGGPMECSDGKLVCQWHGAAFDLATGERLEGPAPRNSRLMFLSTRVENGALHYVWGE